MPGLIGYDPNRTHELRLRVRVATEHLLRLPPSADPLAAAALSLTRLVRAHLEHDWLPALDRVLGSTAMLGFSETGVGGLAEHGLRSPLLVQPARADDGGPPASNSLDSELNPAPEDASPEPAEPITEVVLPNGWSYQSGPVSASTGQPASGGAWMPPTYVDMGPPLLIASFLPGTGEIIDLYDCATDVDIPCELIAVPFVSGRGVNAVEEVLTGVNRAVDARRSFDFTSAKSWANSEKLPKHFKDHGADFGATSAEEYARQASDFFDRAVTENLPTKVDPDDGRLRFWDPATNTFGSYTRDGQSITFFKPTSPTYWERQPG